MPRGPWFRRLAVGGIALPFLANSAGWIFTEMGRQPFVVVPNPSGVDGVWMFTAQGVSGLTLGEVFTSLIVLTVLYGALAVVELLLLIRYARAGVAGVLPPKKSEAQPRDELAFAY
jgi:cytochrome d ubiquinol oxidase subunit I